ncbi:hypothetical protein LJC05_01920 [Bacteroides sp. OttesenSCG-928-J23]|nr:hypothetical protein [Bacteroides sp. OttesenSCG-928-J23]
MKKVLFTLGLVFCLCIAANAQQRYTWNQYGLSFTVPSNFKITENTAESFQANNGKIHLAIAVIDYDGIDEDGLAEVLISMAEEAGITDGEVGPLALTTLEGAYIEGVVNGSNMCLVLLADTESNIALVASVVYADGLENQANNIINSFSIK